MLNSEQQSNIENDRFRELRIAIKEEIHGLKEATKEGFDSLLHELRLSREQGHIPVAVMEKILHSNNDAYKEIMKSNNEAHRDSRKSTDESNRKILSTICWMMAGLLMWVTGMKIFLPDQIIETTKAVIQGESSAIPLPGDPSLNPK